LPRAAGLADEIERRFGVKTELKEGSGGVFDVEVDEELIFSKHELGRFPGPGEVEGMIAGILQDQGK